MFFFFFNDTATTEIYTLSLHDALPISLVQVLFLPSSELFGLVLRQVSLHGKVGLWQVKRFFQFQRLDRKSTRLNSSHQIISYAVFCLKKKKKRKTIATLITRILGTGSG